MLYSVVRQLRRRHGRPPLGAALRRLGLPALLAVLGPGLLAGLSDDDPAGITTYSIAGARYGYHVALGPAAVGRGAGRLPRARRATRARHGTGPASRSSAPRTARATAFAVAHARGREPRHDLRRVRGRRRRARARGHQPLSLRAGRRGARRHSSSCAAASTASSTCCCCSRRCFITYVGAAFLAHPDWAERRPRPGRPDDAAHPRRADRHHRHRRHHAGALGACLHPVLRGGQAPDAGTTCASSDRRRLGRGADGHHRRLRRDRVRRDAARERTRDIDRRTRCRTSRSSRSPGSLASTLFAARPRRRCAARGRRRPAVDRLLGLGVVRPRVPARRLLRRGAVLLSHLSRRSRPGCRVRPHPRPAAGPGALPDPGAERGAPVAAARRVARAGAGQALAGRLRERTGRRHPRPLRARLVGRAR